MFTVNPDCLTATIHFQESYVTELDPVFRDYPITEGRNIDEEKSIDEYSLSRFTEDHQRYNKYLAKDAGIRCAKETELSAHDVKPTLASDCSDIVSTIKKEG